ncbi:MAG: TonB-dependent receptor, partial [Bacteroidales bacterium]
MKNTRFYLSMLIVFISISIAAQNFTVSGVVKDEAGEPVIGASVLEKGTKNGTVTNYDGEFSLDVSGKHPLVISYIGMKSQEVDLKNRKTVQVVLQSSAEALDEVVVIGYGTTRKKDLTGSVASVSGAEIAKVPVTNAAQALTGRMAGVQVTTSDGSPDAEVIIRVRGGGSVTGDNSPLYIVDGFPVSSISDIPTSDIQSIDLLKDASSTAIYGSQGANGVIIITTKSAQGGKTQVSYNGYVQIKNLSKRLDVLDPYEYVLYNYELLAFDKEDGIKTFNKKFGVFDDISLYRYQTPNDGQDEMFGSNKVSQSHNISINGGSDKTKFYLSGTYNKDDGLMKTDNYERFNTNFKLNHEIAKNLRFNFNGRFSDTEINGSGTSGGTYKVRTSQALTKPAVGGLSDMTIVDKNDMTDEEWEEYLESQMTLAEQAAQYWKKRNNRTFNFTASLDWEIIKGLTYRLEGGYDYGFNETKNYWGEKTTNASYVDGKPLVDWTKQNTNRYRIANTLSYRIQLKKNRMDLLVGQEINSSGKDENYMYATSFSTDLTPDKIFANIGLSNGSLNSKSRFYTKENLASFFGRANYSYDDRYLLSVTFRADGSSKFAPGKQWGYFPSTALAWRISQEHFMQDYTWLSNLKLRLSYGEVGNNRIASSLYKLDYAIQSTKTYGWGDQQNNYYATTNTQMANPNLRWETTITRNAGLDFGVLDEKFTGTIDVYWNTAQDLLIERNIIAPGYKTTMENIGKTSNKGVEATFNAYILQKKDYSLSATFNIGFNRSNVDKLANGITMQEYSSGWAGTDLKGFNDYRVIVGEPVGLIYGFVTDGYYTTNDFERYDPVSNQYILKKDVPTTGMLGGKIGIRPGTIKLKDLDNNGVVDENDRQIIGKTDPKFIGGFGLNGTFKGFDAAVMFNFVYGNKVYNANKIASTQRYRASYNNLMG